MARGSEGKARRKEARKEARTGEGTDPSAGFDETASDDEDLSLPMPPSVSGSKQIQDDNTDEIVEGENLDAHIKKKMDERKSKRVAEKLAAMKAKEPKEGIKTLPLILLILLLGTTLLPALLYVSDRLGGMVQKRGVLSTLGQKLGVGPSPRKRVISFYEKHDPAKLKEVNDIISKYYGDYPTLIKRLERKYHDYGYFLNWEEDDAAWKLAMEKLVQTRKYMEKRFDRYAPKAVQNGVYNAKINFSKLYRKGRIIWRKKIWPVLEPFFGVPEGSAAQKKKDRQDAMNKKSGGRRKKNEDFRDDEY